MGKLRSQENTIKNETKINLGNYKKKGVYLI